MLQANTVSQIDTLPDSVLSESTSGIRVNAWVSGGFLPAAMRGKKLEGLVRVFAARGIVYFAARATNSPPPQCSQTAIWDWYATFSVGLGGLSEEDIVDKAAAEANLPPLDSLNLW